MEIYIIERDNPYDRPEPEVLLDGNKALQIVREEYEEQMKELGANQAESDAGFGYFGCYWHFFSGRTEGSASIDSDYDGDKWSWRITKHTI